MPDTSRRLAEAMSEVEAALRFGARRADLGTVFRRDAPVSDAGPAAPDGRAGIAQAIRRHLESCRCHAEAVLVRERLGEVILNVDERERLTRRALGILPETEAGRMGELNGCPELQAGTVARAGIGLADASDAIEETVGASTALVYTMLIVAGIRSRRQLLESAREVDRLYDRVTSGPAVIQALDAADRDRADGRDAGFQLRFGVLLAAREQLWHLKPERLSTPFLLPQVLEAYLGRERGAGNSLGLAVVDAIVIGRLGFPFRFRVESGMVSLEVTLEGRPVYWDTHAPNPLSFVPVGNSRLLSGREFLALVVASLAAAFCARGRYDAAADLYEQAIALNPESADSHNSLAACLIRRQMPEQAVRSVERALQLGVETAEAYHNLGNACAMMRKWPRAIEAFKKAMTLRPDYVEACNNLGFAFYRSGDTAQAIAAFEAGIEMRPDYAQAHFNLGTVCFETGRYDLADRCYRAALRLEPSLVAAHYNLGQACYRSGRLDEAIACYRRTVKINPRHFGAWHNLGIAYRDKGMRDKAVEALEQAVAINPNLMR